MRVGFSPRLTQPRPAERPPREPGWNPRELLESSSHDVPPYYTFITLAALGGGALAYSQSDSPLTPLVSGGAAGSVAGLWLGKRLGLAGKYAAPLGAAVGIAAGFGLGLTGLPWAVPAYAALTGALSTGHAARSIADQML